MTVEEANELALQTADAMKKAADLLNKFHDEAPQGWEQSGTPETQKAGVAFVEALDELQNAIFE